MIDWKPTAPNPPDWMLLCHHEVDDWPPQSVAKPVQARNGAGAYSGPVVGKGSQIAPKRDSSADLIDGRSARAKDRNARLNLSLSSNHLDAFKWWARDNGGLAYNDVFEDWVAENCQEHLRRVIEDKRKREEI